MTLTLPRPSVDASVLLQQIFFYPLGFGVLFHEFLRAVASTAPFSWVPKIRILPYKGLSQKWFYVMFTQYQ